MKKVITYGSFDLFHEGHYNLLKRAKDLGDYLIVGVTTEKYDYSRGKLNIYDSLATRIENVKATGFVDEVIIEEYFGQKVEDIQNYNIDIFTVGSDWRGRFEYIRDLCDVVYLERTKNISSTIIRNSEKKILSLGIIGTGRISRRFISEIKYVSGINVSNVYNPNINSAKKYATDFELNSYSNNLDEFFSTINCVYIASPHETHYEYIKKALLSDIHVICEKPLVLIESQAIELYNLADERGLVLLEAIKTAYLPGFNEIISNVKSMRIGKVKDIEATFTKLISGNARELDPNVASGALVELISYPLLPIFKIFGTNYKDINYETFINSDGVDVYTKVILKYDNAIATAKVGIGVKSEGNLVISGTKGYLKVDAPWWKTKNAEICFENVEENEFFNFSVKGEGLRYEISEFIKIINNNTINNKLRKEESIAIANVIEKFKKINTNIYEY